MTHAIKTPMFLVAVAALLFTACEKKDYIAPRTEVPVPTTPGKPAEPGVEVTNLRVKVAIRIGSVMYDSIPASLQINSFDSSGQVTTKIMQLEPGTNTIALYGKPAKYTLKMSKWGLSDEKTVTKQELQTAGVITLGGSKKAKKLQMEESFTFIPADGSYRPQGKTVYKYDAAGRLSRAIYYQRYPQQAELKLTLVDKFVYEPGGRLDRIDRFDAARDTTVVPVSFTAFNYDGQGRVAQIYNNQTTETAARVSYGLENGFATINLSYYFGNNASMNYTMKFKGGNKVADGGQSSTGSGESGTYTYDNNINPYVHMSWPDLYLSHESRNNVVAQQKSYGGAYPSGDPYKFEYQYDADGYPASKITTYKSVFTGEDLYTTRTVYTY